MPQIAEIKVIENEVWCRVIVMRNTDVCGPITLYTPEEVEDVRKQAVRDFLNQQLEDFFNAR